MVYAPVKMIDSEEKLASMEQTKLEHAYTFWIIVQEQKFVKKKDSMFEQFDQELREIETVDTVSLFPTLTQLSFRLRSFG